MSKNFTPITYTPKFVKTPNVRVFSTKMDALSIGAGEGRLGLFFGRAGLGKSRTAQWWTAETGSRYLRVVTVWSELDFLKGLCREVGVIDPPHRRGACFSEIIDKMVRDPRPVFIDELEKMNVRMLDLIRDLSDISTAPFILIGEEELATIMKRNRRVWSRTFQTMEFQPIGVPDILMYCGEVTSVTIEADVAGLVHQHSCGDFRLVKRLVIAMVQYANSVQKDRITMEMAQTAINSSLSGE